VDLGQLEVLVAVARERGFTRAAVRLRRTQPAVSQAIRRLELEVGEALIDRSSKDGTLTAAGRVLQDYAQQMLNLRRDAQASLQELRSLTRGKVVVAASEFTMMHLLPILAAFHRDHPEVRLEVKRSQASKIPSEILGREVELGIITYRPRAPGLTAFPVARDELALLVAPHHELARRGQVSVVELGAQRFLAHNPRSPYRERVVKTFERHRTPLHISMELPTLEAIKRLVARGLGVALMPRRAAQAEVERGELAALTVREMRLERPVHLVHRRGAGLSHAARALVRCARELAPEA
jgi:DNA-binding transcriptional LysR family regulator